MSVAQSICTHYFCFENMGRFVTLKKSGPKYGPEKSRLQKTGLLLFKKRRGTLRFSGPFFGLDFFEVPDPKKISGPSDKVEKWVQEIDWTAVFNEW